MYISDQKCGKVHKKKCHVFSQAPHPKYGAGQGSSEAEGAPPCRTPIFLHISLALEQSPGLSWEGRGFFGNIHLVQLSLVQRQPWGWCYSLLRSLICSPQGHSVTERPSPGSWDHRENLKADSCPSPPDTPISEPQPLLLRRQGQLYSPRHTQTLTCQVLIVH